MDKFCDTLVYTKHTELLFEPEKKWFENKVIGEPEQTAPIKNVQQITALREHARKVYDQDIINYNDCNNSAFLNKNFIRHLLVFFWSQRKNAQVRP